MTRTEIEQHVGVGFKLKHFAYYMAGFKESLVMKYEIAVQSSGARFSVRVWVAKSLQLTCGDFIYLRVSDGRTKKLLLKGNYQMRSGLEIFGQDIRGHLKPGQHIVVEASKKR